MIEIILILGMACMPDAPDCHIEASATTSPISSMLVCEEMAITIPAELERIIPGLVVEARCEKQRKEVKEEK
jgi:hypothetical protein